MNPEQKIIPETEDDRGIVVELKGEFAVVEMETTDACQCCRAKVVCQPNSAGQRFLQVKNTLNVKIGDRVVLEQSGANQIRLVMVQYGLPLLGFLTGVFAGRRLFPQGQFGIPAEVIQLLGGIVLVLLTGIGIFFWSKYQARREFNVFRLRRIINSKTE